MALLLVSCEMLFPKSQNIVRMDLMMNDNNLEHGSFLELLKLKDVIYDCPTNGKKRKELGPQ